MDAIKNKELKEEIAAIIVGLARASLGLPHAKEVKTEVKFGYLYIFKERGVESLIKITLGSEVLYYAIQQGKAVLLNFNEDTFIAATDSFLKVHK